MADIAVGGDQLLNGGALAAQFRICARGNDDLGATLLCALGKGIDDGHVRHVFGVAAIHCGDMLQCIKVFTPGIRHAARVGQITFIHLFHVRCVAAEEIRIALIGFVYGCGFAHIPLTSASLEEALAG
ncbi:hypothetical protein SDC9_112382 [bioreactor metagenome]|uniref:Uncharacterized protein n=1 Tax=bioreactor metagenome TaxID=1076179 RepID=A0A645BJB2_9ZZZZ